MREKKTGVIKPLESCSCKVLKLAEPEILARAYTEIHLEDPTVLKGLKRYNFVR